MPPQPGRARSSPVTSTPEPQQVEPEGNPAHWVSPRPDHIAEQYHHDRATGAAGSLLDEPALAQWQHWRVIANRYPYANWYQTHHLLIPMSGVAATRLLGSDERKELDEVLYEWAPARYHQYFENLTSLRSITTLLHFHLVNLHGFPPPGTPAAPAAPSTPGETGPAPSH